MKRKKYVWNNAKSEEFVQSISSVNTLNKLSDIVQGIGNITDCETMSKLTSDFTSVLCESADQLFVKYSTNRVKRNNTEREWYTEECSEKREQFYAAMKEYKNSKTNEARVHMVHCRSAFKAEQ